jgi:hypothetical protein
MPAIGLLKNIVGFVSYAFTIFIPVYPLLIALLIKRKIIWIEKSKPLVYHLFWLVPAMIFFMIGHYSKGYIYLIYPAMFIFYGLFYLKNFKSLKLLYATIAVQLAFFLFYPYSQVSLDDRFRREMRQSSLVEVFWNRLNNGYLHTLSRLDFENTINTSFDDCVGYLKKNHPNFVLFDGKSSMMTINAEAYKHQDLTFVTQKNFHHQDEYILQKKFKLEYRYGLNELYRKVYILCDKRMLPHYKDLVNVVYVNDIHAVVKVKEGKEQEFEEYYEKLYAKN